MYSSETVTDLIVSSYHCILVMVAETQSHALRMLGQDSALWQLCESLYVSLCVRMWYLRGVIKGDYTGDLHPSQFNILNFFQNHVDNFLYWYEKKFPVFLSMETKRPIVCSRDHTVSSASLAGLFS